MPASGNADSPEETEDGQHAWARSYFKMLEESYYANKLDSSKINELITLMEAFDRSITEGKKKAGG